jgi:hypothetical protein
MDEIMNKQMKPPYMPNFTDNSEFYNVETGAAMMETNISKQDQRMVKKFDDTFAQAF